jgi:hypothetical protein
VPRPVAFVVEQFAPGVQIGAKVSDMRHAVAAMSYVPHLGFVGMPAETHSSLPGGGIVRFAQVRLLLDERTRSQPNPDPTHARVDAVEIVATDSYASSEIANALIVLFRRPPRDGCLHTSDENHLRDVHIWPTPNEHGGVALINDYQVGPVSRSAPPVPSMTSVLAFTGKFDGGRTLRGNYVDASCALTVQTQ